MEVIDFSHVAIGVSDMERSIVFYRDVLGLRLDMDAEEKGHEAGGFHRRAVYLRWGEGSAGKFIVLDCPLNRPPAGEPLKMFQRGLHHVSLSVTDIDAVLARATALGADIVRPPSIASGRAYGDPTTDQPVVKTVFLRDPDGVLVQLDQWL